MDAGAHQKVREAREHDQPRGIVATTANKDSNCAKQGSGSRQWICVRTVSRDADGQRAELGGATQPDSQAVQHNSKRVRHPMRGHAQPEAAPGTSCGPLSTPAGFLNRQVPGTSYRILARLLANHANTKKYELY